jgi:hypothetical protein
MAVTVVLGAAAFVLAPRLVRPVYRSEVVLAIRQNLQADTVLGNESAAGESRRTRNAYLKEMLLSRPNLRWVIEQENLSPGTVAKIGMTAATEDLAAQISFGAGESNTILVGYHDADPKQAQRVARRLGESLARQVGRDNAQRAESTRKFLEQEQAKLGKELQEKEEDYARFVALHPEFAPERRYGQTAAGPSGALARTGVESVDSADPAAALRRQADRLRRRLDQVKNPQANNPPASPPPAAPQLTPESRDAIAAAERDVQQAKQELEARQLQYTGRHPDLLAAQARLSAARSRLTRTKAAAEAYVPPAAPLQPPASVQPQARQDLERQLRTLEATMASPRDLASAVPSGAPLGGNAAAIVSLETQWTSLTRDVAAMRERYEAIQRRYFRAFMVATAEASGGGTQLTVAEDAYLPKLPVRRGPKRTGAAGSLAVVAFGTLLTLGLGYLDQRTVTKWDLDRLGLGPITLIVPRLKPKGKDGYRG